MEILFPFNHRSRCLSKQSWKQVLWGIRKPLRIIIDSKWITRGNFEKIIGERLIVARSTRVVNMRKAVIRELQFLSILRMTRSSVYYQFIKCFSSRSSPGNLFLYPEICSICVYLKYMYIYILMLLMKLFYL